LINNKKSKAINRSKMMKIKPIEQEKKVQQEKIYGICLTLFKKGQAKLLMMWKTRN
jgi:hypothetical protein